MSREQFRARSKRVQKLGRDGLVEQDRATGEERRVSQRTADISFGPERSPEAELGRTPPPAKGRRRKQPRPAPPPEAAQAGTPDTPTLAEPDRTRANTPADAPNEPGTDSPSAPSPAMRGMEDTPAATPPHSVRDIGHPQKLRQRRQADRFRQTATTPGPTSGRARVLDSDVPAEQGQNTGLGRPHLRFEDEPVQDPASVLDTSIQDASVQDTSGHDIGTQDTGGRADAPPPRPKRRRYTMAEQSGRRLERAQAKLPAPRRARLAQEYDANTGRVRRRLRFEGEAAPEPTQPIPVRAAGAVKAEAMGKLHGRLREAEQDNVAVEAAHEGELAAGRTTTQARQRLRSKPYRAARRRQAQQASSVWQTALRDNPKLRRQGVLSKWVQKRKLKRRYAQAAREAQKTPRRTRQTAAVTGKTARTVQKFAAAHKGVLLLVGGLTLGIAFLSAGLASCTAILSSTESAAISTVYLADDQEICDAELLFTEMEADLQLDIANTEANHPGYDEYRYNIGEISHNPYELMSYLTAAYNFFTYEQVRPEVERLFAEKYQLTRSAVTETRYDDGGNPYEWRVLQTTLTVKRLGGSISAALPAGEQTERYNLYMQTMGGRQAFGNPFDSPWLDHISSGYGWRIHPSTGAKDLHRGVDIAAAQGAAIQAVRDGRVVSAGDAGSYGLCVVIEDDKGYQARYAHCASLNVSAGQEVKRGDVIGTVGSTGDSIGPHLHLEVMRDGEYLNPYYFVDTGGYTAALPGTPGGPEIPDYPGEPPTDETYAAMLAEAEKYLGYPYVWGGTNPTTSFDCSGYVSWVINHCGAGWNYGRLGVMGLEDICTPVSAANAQPGDLVFFIGTYDAPYPNRPTHVGIYVGNGRMIHCGDPISYASINTPYWQQHFYGFGRLPTP